MTNGSGWAGLLSIALLGCGVSSSTPLGGPQPERCSPPPDATGTARIADVFIDGQRVASGVPARLESESPEVYSLVEPEPDPVRALAPGSIDLIQFLHGPDAERAYGLCSGVVVFMITLRRP